MTCPAHVIEVGKSISWRTVRGVQIGIVPGLAVETPFGEPDRLRGEEMELLGWLSQSDHDQALVCLPGTHSKWVEIKGGAVESFLTGFAGELFSLLGTQSILISQSPQSESKAAFAEGLNLGFAEGADLMHSLFSVRSRQISGALPAEHARSFLSGLITAADISGALRQFGSRFEQVTVIASPELGEAYRRGFERGGVGANTVDGLEASVLGFSALQSQGI